MDQDIIDIICINKTRLDATVSNHKVGVNGYKMVRKDRNRNGESVAIYVKTHINYKVRKELISRDLEMVTVEISKPKSRSFLINCWFRPPDSQIEMFNIYEDLVKKWNFKIKKKY